MEPIEPITDYLKRKLKEAGANRFDAIAEAATELAWPHGVPDGEHGVTGSFIRKFVYGSRENPRVQTVQPLLDYFAAIDRRELRLPDPPRESAATASAHQPS